MEQTILERAPATVLVLLKAEPPVIRRRMRANPDTAEAEPSRRVVREEDIEYVLGRFEQQFECSLISNKFVLDTTAATVDQTMAQFLEKFEPYFTESDLRRIKRPAS